MLSKILSKSDCASCRFCCSFRRSSLWETPLFTPAEKEALSTKYPFARFKRAALTSWTIDLDSAYKTSDPAEEAPCPFLDPSSGCILTAEEKPFDCSIWPLRIVNLGGKNTICLTPTCPAINKVPLEEVKKLACTLRGPILEKAAANPDMVKNPGLSRDDFIPLTE